MLIFDDFEEAFALGKSKSESNEISVHCFTYERMLNYYCSVSAKIPGIASSQISICKESEYKKIYRPQERWVITQIFCDALGKPLINPSNGQNGYGRIVIADSFDMKFSKFMNGRTQASFKPSIEEMKRITENQKKSIYQRILEKVAVTLDNATTPEFTVSMLKNYRTLSTSKVIVAKIDVMLSRAKSSSFDSSLFDKNDFVIAEYDEKSDRIIRSEVIKPDEKIKALVEKNSGVIIVED